MSILHHEIPEEHANCSSRVAGPSITLDEAREARRSQVVTGDSYEPATTSIAVEGAKEEPQTLTFAQLKALIEQGRTDEIPNNKVIPDILSVRTSVVAPPRMLIPFA